MPDEDKVPIQDDVDDTDDTDTNPSPIQPFEIDPDEDSASTINEVDNARQLRPHMSTIQALMNFIKGNIGTGILSMPMVLKMAGIWIGIPLIIASSVLATYCMHLLAIVADDLVVKHTINGFLIVTQVGFCCVYTLFLTQNILLFTREFLSENKQVIIDQPRWFYLTAFLVCALLTPIAIFRSMRMLTHLSVVSNICIIFGLMFIFAYIGYAYPAEPPKVSLFNTTATGLLVAFSIVVYSVEGISLVLPIQSKMADPVMFHAWYGVVNTGMIIVICLFVAVGCFGYLAFGEGVKGSITLNIPSKPYWFAPIKPLFILGTVGSYLIQFYVPIVIIGRLMEKLSCHHDASELRRNVHKKLMRASLVWLAFVATITIPHIELMISLIGAVASSFLAFILPPTIYMAHFWPNRHSMSHFSTTIFFNAIALVVGFLAMFGGSVSTILQLIEVSSSSPSPSP